jgi:phosphoglucosamine mutase
VKENHLDVGFAFDGDADRCIAVDGNGEVVDGDKMLYILGKRLKSRGMLNHDTVVATVMSNSGFFTSLEEAGIKCEQTNVGDRFVYECMQEKGYALGGECHGAYRHRSVCQRRRIRPHGDGFPKGLGAVP